MKGKTRGKRLFSILLCFVMLLSLVPSTVFAAESTDITDYIDSYMIGGKTYWNVSQSNSGEGWRYEVRFNNIPTIILNGYNGGDIRFNMKSDAPATTTLLSVSGTNNVDGMIYAGQMDYINLQINLSSGAVLNASEIYTSPNYESEEGNLSHVNINGPASGEYASVNLENDGYAITVGCKAEVISNLGNVVAHVDTQAFGKLYCSGRVNVIAHSVTDHAIYSGFKYEYVENFVDSSVARYYYQCTGIDITAPATLLAFSSANDGTKSAINNYEPHMKPFSGKPLFDSIPDDYAAVYPDNCDLIYFAPREVLREYLDFTNPLSDTTVEVGTQTYTIGVKALPCEDLF